MWVNFAILSAIFAALTTILAKIGVAKIDSNLATAIRTTVILVFAWGIVFINKTKIPSNLFTGKTVLFLVLSGLATGLSWLFYFRALQLGPASKVAPLDKLSLVFSLILAWAVLGEKLSWQVVSGMLLMLIGTLLITLAK